VRTLLGEKMSRIQTLNQQELKEFEQVPHLKNKNYPLKRGKQPRQQLHPA